MKIAPFVSESPTHEDLFSTSMIRVQYEYIDHDFSPSTPVLRIEKYISELSISVRTIFLLATHYPEYGRTRRCSQPLAAPLLGVARTHNFQPIHQSITNARSGWLSLTLGHTGEPPADEIFIHREAEVLGIFDRRSGADPEGQPFHPLIPRITQDRLASPAQDAHKSIHLLFEQVRVMLDHLTLGSWIFMLCRSTGHHGPLRAATMTTSQSDNAALCSIDRPSAHACRAIHDQIGVIKRNLISPLPPHLPRNSLRRMTCAFDPLAAQFTDMR